LLEQLTNELVAKTIPRIKAPLMVDLITLTSSKALV